MSKTKTIAGCALAILLLSCSGKQATLGKAVRQKGIAKVDSMPDMPSDYQMLDWKQKALDFDRFVFDWHNKSAVGPLIWLDKKHRNFDQDAFGLYTAVGDIRQGEDHNNGEFHESLNSLAAVLGAGLVGIDKTNQDGYNYVKMEQNYFNRANGWNIMMNNTSRRVGLLGGGYGRDWWYDVFPNALYYAVCDVFPNVSGADEIQHTIAEQFVKADSVLNGNYNYSFFDYSKMKGEKNQIPFEQDAAGGHAYVLLCAYHKFNDQRYLKHAESAVQALVDQKESPFYEILLPLGVYSAAYLNATQHTDYDLDKLLRWTFDGCKNPKKRYGWGVIAGKWGNYEVNGLQGSTIDGGGYAFLMNSIKLSWPLIPMVKYQPQYARAIGKWMLNNANSCRLFFPQNIDDQHQWAPELKDLTHNVIAYEGLRRTDCYDKPSLKGVTPVALGDGPHWIKGNPTQSMFSLYSTSPVGIFGALIKPTNVRGILQLDCNATDFYAQRHYPVYLYYNPYKEAKSVQISVEDTADLFDIVSKTYVAKNLTKSGSFTLPADKSRVVVVLPAGTQLSVNNKNQIVADGKYIIAYN